MLNDNSSALSSVAAASRRLDAPPSNTTNASAAGGAIPAGDAGEERQGYLPVRVEQSANSEGSTTTFERYVRPPYVPVFVSSTFPNSEELLDEPSQGVVSEAIADTSEEIVEEITAEASAQANEQSAQSVSDMVKKLYDLPE